jgi:hypothetical protein
MKAVFARKRGFLLLLVATITCLGIIPAHAKALGSKTVTMNATPCAALCSYNVPHASDPTLFVNSELGSAADSERQTAYACTEPEPAGSYADVVVKAPAGAKLLVLNYQPSVDWDAFICLKPKSGNNGPMVGRETDATFVIGGACTANCKSTATAKVKPGVQYVIRGYNFDSPDSLKMKYTFFG